MVKRELGTTEQLRRHAYVGYSPTKRLWLYDDYHFDGLFYRDLASGANASGIWQWYG